MACLLSANAFTLTYLGDNTVVTEGQTIEFYGDKFENPIPVLTEGSAKFKLDATYSVTVSAQGQAAYQICQDGGAGTCLASQADFSLNGNFPSCEAFHVAVTGSHAPGQAATIQNLVSVKVTAGGQSLNFKVDFNSSKAGIEDVMVDASGVYNVYNVNGVKVLETTDAEDVKALPAGLYLVNGKKVYVK